jgi:hypothetical protein
MQLFDFINNIKYTDNSELIWSLDIAQPELIKRANQRNKPYAIIGFNQWYPLVTFHSCDGAIGVSPLQVYIKSPDSDLGETQHVLCEFLKLPTAVKEYGNKHIYGMNLEFLQRPRYTEKEDVIAELVYNVLIR